MLILPRCAIMWRYYILMENFLLHSTTLQPSDVVPI
jgi:hypothetical protein